MLGVGAALTAIWLAGICAYILLRWDKVRAIADNPNEVGDFLAGASAPLAFTWLVLAVLLQRRELALQRAELIAQREEQIRSREIYSDQRDEMQASTEALRKQTSAIETQSEILSQGLQWLERTVISQDLEDRVKDLAYLYCQTIIFELVQIPEFTRLTRIDKDFARSISKSADQFLGCDIAARKILDAVGDDSDSEKIFGGIEIKDSPESLVDVFCDEFEDIENISNELGLTSIETKLNVSHLFYHYEYLSVMRRPADEEGSQ